VQLPDDVRERFPVFERLTYVNSCSAGALSDTVRAAYDEYLEEWQAEGSPWDRWVDRTERARAAFARLIAADADDVAVATSLSAAVSALATGLGLGERPRIVLTDWEFPTVGQIWHAQERRGAEVVHVAEERGELPLERFEHAIDERTALVSITHVCYRNGARVDVAGVVRLARERGALVLLDAYQSAGSLPLDVRMLDVDVLAAGTTKYLLGSPGLAFLWCRPGLAAQITPAATGWFADEDVFAMDVHDYSPAPDARRFQSGTPPVPSIYAGLAGIELIEQVGVESLARHVRELNARLEAGLDELGATLATPREPGRRGALVCVRSTDAPGLVAALRGEGVVVSERAGNVRISPHLYNSAADVDAVLASLARNRGRLA
jgi:selenocysteine lyase/cysteine desulfurase